MRVKSICLSVFAVVFLSLIMLTNGIVTMLPEEEPVMSDELKFVDPTDMSQYYSMGEYYPPDNVENLNIFWQGGRVEVVAYNEDYYFVEEAATRQLMEYERLVYQLEDGEFTVAFTAEDEEPITDAYKKLEVRIPREKAQQLKSLNIVTNGEVVLRNITAEQITVNGKAGDVRCDRVYSKKSKITTTDGSVSLVVAHDIGYAVDFATKTGKLDSYVDNGMYSYVSGDGTYPFEIKTKSGDLHVSLYEES